MIRQTLLRATRTSIRSAPRPTFTPRFSIPTTTTSALRTFTASASRLEPPSNKDDPDAVDYDSSMTFSEPGASGAHEGQHARIDEKIRIDAYEHEDLPDTRQIREEEARRKPTLSSFSLEGRTSVVTGGARGLGLVMSQALVTSGSDVAIVDLNEDAAKQAAERLVEVFKAENPKATRVPTVTYHQSDVSSPSSVHTCVNGILKRHSKIDTLVTSAGFTENIPAVDYPPDRLEKCFQVNVNGTFYFATEVAKHLMARGAPGSMVFIGSMSGSIVNVPQPQAPYNAAKAAVRHLAASLAVEWAGYGIRVNNISPGYMFTPLTEKILEERPDLREKWTSLVPMGKLGRAEDLMGLVAYLASDASLYVTGADMRVDGGYTVT